MFTTTLVPASSSSDKVCDKVSGKGRLKWDLSAFNMSRLQRRDAALRRPRPPPSGGTSCLLLSLDGRPWDCVFFELHFQGSCIKARADSSKSVVHDNGRR